MKRVSLFGDSIMAGYTNGQDTQLIIEGLTARLPETAFFNRAYSGATTVEALDFLTNVTADPYDKVVLEFGTNDCSTSYGIALPAYQDNLKTLVNQLDPNKVLLIGPNYSDPKRNPDKTWQRIQLFNTAAKKLALSAHLPFFDLAHALYDTGQPDSFLQADGIHLNQAGNKIFLDGMANLIKESLN